MYNEDYPLVLGLAGEAGTGKTSSARVLCPQSRVFNTEGMLDPTDDKYVKPYVYWTHLWHAIPLYKMAAARQNIVGAAAHDRICYEILNTLLDLWGGSPLWGAPTFDELYEMVYEIATYPCPADGKPREFLQYVGTDLIRKHDPDAWVNWMRRQVLREHAIFVDEYTDVSAVHSIVISDVRFPNELESIRAMPNGVLVRLKADPEVLSQRLADRDGDDLAPGEKEHVSEQSLKDIPDSYFDAIIDTTNMSVQEQAAHQEMLILDRLNGRRTSA